MKIAAIADAHLRGKDLPYFEAQLRESLHIMRERDVQVLFFVGDVFDHPNIASGGKSVGDLVHALKQLLSDVPVHDVYVIAGQHDKENETTRSALETLDGMRGMHVIRSAKRLRFADGSADKLLAVDCVPWEYRESSYESITALREGPQSDLIHRTVLCAHLQVRGARMNGGHVCSRGSFSLSPTQLLSLRYDRIWLGDFHERQDVANGSGGYVGSLRQLSFAHVSQPQGFEIYDSETNTAEFVEVNEAPRHEVLIWRQGEPRPVPTPTYRTRIKTDGWIATAADKRLTGDDAELDVSFAVQAKKTAARIAIDVDTVADSPAQLLDLYIDQNDIAVTDRTRLHTTLNELTA